MRPEPLRCRRAERLPPTEQDMSRRLLPHQRRGGPAARSAGPLGRL